MPIPHIVHYASVSESDIERMIFALDRAAGVAVARELAFSHNDTIAACAACDAYDAGEAEQSCAEGARLFSELSTLATAADDYVALALAGLHYEIAMPIVPAPLLTALAADARAQAEARTAIVQGQGPHGTVTSFLDRLTDLRADYEAGNVLGTVGRIPENPLPLGDFPEASPERPAHAVLQVGPDGRPAFVRVPPAGEDETRALLQRYAEDPNSLNPLDALRLMQTGHPVLKEIRDRSRDIVHDYLARTGEAASNSSAEAE